MAEYQQPRSESYSLLEVAPTQHVTNSGDDPNPKFSVNTSQEHTDSRFVPQSSSRSFWRRKWVWIVCFAVIVIVAVVGGTVGGIVSKRHSKPNGDGTATSTTGSVQPSKTATTTPTMSGSATALSSYLYPTALSWGYPHLEVLVLSNNHSVHRKYRSPYATTPDAWSPQDGSFELVGGVIADFENGVAAIARSPGTANMFVIGSPATSSTLFHKWHDDWSLVWDPVGYDAWEGHGGTLASGPTLVSWAKNRLDVFAIGGGPSYELFQMFWNGDGWSDYINLHGTWSTFAPTAVSWGVGRIDVFVVNPVNKALYHKYWDGSTWQPPDTFNKLGGYCASRPVAVSWGVGRIDLFVRGGDAGLWHKSYSGDTWSDWISISGNTTIQAEPEAVCWGPNRIDVFAWGADDSLFHKSYDWTPSTGTGVWSPSDGSESIGRDLGGPPKAVSDGEGSIHVFGYAQHGELVHKAWNETLGAWTPANDFEILGTPP